VQARPQASQCPFTHKCATPKATCHTRPKACASSGGGFASLFVRWLVWRGVNGLVFTTPEKHHHGPGCATATSDVAHGWSYHTSVLYQRGPPSLMYCPSHWITCDLRNCLKIKLFAGKALKANSRPGKKPICKTYSPECQLFRAGLIMFILEVWAIIWHFPWECPQQEIQVSAPPDFLVTDPGRSR